MLLALLPACRVGPEYERPHLPTPPKYEAVTASGYSDAEPWSEWWKVFGDARLDALVAEAMAGSHDLRAAVARVKAARALARQAGAERSPQLSAAGGATRQQRSAESLVQNGQALGIGRPFNLFSATLDARYEIDLFGRTARADAAAAADAEAAEQDRRALQIALAAEVASAWFDLCAASEEEAILGETLRTREASLRLVRVRQESGLATELDLRQAESALETVRAALPASGQRSAVASHRLTLLCGKPPASDDRAHDLATLAVPPQVPLGLPASLLERRPDLRATEARLVAATERHGQAVAEFFPSVTLVGSFGYEARDADRLGKGTTELWSIGPGIHLPIFSGGRIQAQELLRAAQAEEASANYARTVISALTEVADAIVALDAGRATLSAQQAVLAAEHRLRVIAEVQYEQGLAAYLVVLDSQRSELGAKVGLVAARRALLGSVVGLCKALGGGWEEAGR